MAVAPSTFCLAAAGARSALCARVTKASRARQAATLISARIATALLCILYTLLELGDKRHGVPRSSSVAQAAAPPLLAKEKHLLFYQIRMFPYKREMLVTATTASLRHVGGHIVWHNLVWWRRHQITRTNRTWYIGGNGAESLALAARHSSYPGKIMFIFRQRQTRLAVLFGIDERKAMEERTTSMA